MCKLCKQSYHGENKRCSKVNDLKLWARGNSRHRIRNCPSCKVLIEKEYGCPHMTCNSCNYEFCWICSLRFKSYVHILSLPFCEFMNKIVYHEGEFDRMFIKCIWLRFLACYLLFIVTPVIMIAWAPILCLFCGPCFFKKEFSYRISARYRKYEFLLSIIGAYIILILFIGLSPLWIVVYYLVFLMFTFLILFE